MRTRGKDKKVSDSSRGDRVEGPRKDAAIESSAVSGAFALLAEMTQDFADSMDVEGTLSRGLSLIVAHLDSEAGSLWLVDSETGGVTCEASVEPSRSLGTLADAGVRSIVGGFKSYTHASTSATGKPRATTAMTSVTAKSGTPNRGSMRSAASITAMPPTV